MTACFPGSFDPVTLGHLDIIRRAAKAADKLIVAVMDNPEKKSLFTAAERVDFIRGETDGLPNVSVESFSGMAAVFALKKEADLLIRGVRDFNDFQYEQVMALYNKKLSGGIDTWFIAPDPGLSHISSSAVKEVAKLISKTDFNTDLLSSLVPERVRKEVILKM